jgi:hypothetical protein
MVKREVGQVSAKADAAPETVDKSKNRRNATVLCMGRRRFRRQPLISPETGLEALFGTAEGCLRKGQSFSVFLVFFVLRCFIS